MSIKNRPVCPACHHKGFKQVESDFKASFVCDRCGNLWASGYDGRPDIFFI